MYKIYMPETIFELKNLLADAAELGAKRALLDLGLSKPYLKEREAKRIYGPTIVERWIKEGLITPVKDGNNTASKRISRIQIEAVAKAANRCTYLTMDERKNQ
ncbi:MAG TPA: hypothetical protein DHV48_12940 [Prolixibacteraceae bacterium]|nr:hypothetical protein [Prolixibacteraceae bacterium]